MNKFMFKNRLVQKLKMQKYGIIIYSYSLLDNIL